MHTVSIDDDVFAAAERVAFGSKTSVDEVITSLSRKALLSAPFEQASRKGFPVLPVIDPSPVTLDFVNSLRDRERA